MYSMFCYQCEQTAKGTGCTGNSIAGMISGLCGKNSRTANEQDVLICELINLARAMREKQIICEPVIDIIVDGLFTTITNVNFDAEKIQTRSSKAKEIRERLGGAEIIRSEDLYKGDDDFISLRSTMLFCLCGMASYAYHARVLGKRDTETDIWFIRGMASLGENRTIDEWLSLLMKQGRMSLKCLELLDDANTAAFGNPQPVKVSHNIRKGPFIVISGHDLNDLSMLLQQTDGKGINVYTHCEMLPAHGYAKLAKHRQLRGNFGTAWQNQQNEFAGIPAPVLFTSNCMMPPKPSYANRAYTTSVTAFPGVRHIETDTAGRKDFAPLINHAIKLGGYDEDMKFTGINGGHAVTTGFGRQAIMDNMPAIIKMAKSGEIRHFFVVGGCDGTRPGRNYYTNFVRQTPPDTLVLTFACGKFRFNDIDAGCIGAFPRIMDVGQCNDAYAAIQAVLALAGAFNCSVNDLPLTLTLSWYEPKAICILITLMSLGIKNIYLGPGIPAFFPENVRKIMMEKFNLRLISTAENDLSKILMREI